MPLDIDCIEELEDEISDEKLTLSLVKLEILEGNEDTEEILEEDMEEELDDEKCMSGNGLSKIYTAVSDPNCIGSPLSATSILSTLL